MGCVKLSASRIGRVVVSAVCNEFGVISALRKDRVDIDAERVQVPLIEAERRCRPILSCSFVCGLSIGPEMTIFDASDGWFVTADGLRIQILI